MEYMTGSQFVFVLFECEDGDDEVELIFIDIFRTLHSASYYANHNFGTPQQGWEPLDDQKHSWLSSNGDFLIEQRTIHP